MGEGGWFTESSDGHGESGGYFSGFAHCPDTRSCFGQVFPPLLVFSRWAEPRIIFPQAPCLAVNPSVRGNDGRKEAVAGQGEKRKYSGTALFCGNE